MICDAPAPLTHRVRLENSCRQFPGVCKREAIECTVDELLAGRSVALTTTQRKLGCDSWLVWSDAPSQFGRAVFKASPACGIIWAGVSVWMDGLDLRGVARIGRLWRERLIQSDGTPPEFTVEEDKPGSYTVRIVGSIPADNLVKIVLLLADWEG